jgi:hypothetical protein
MSFIGKKDFSYVVWPFFLGLNYPTHGAIVAERVGFECILNYIPQAPWSGRRHSITLEEYWVQTSIYHSHSASCLYIFFVIFALTSCLDVVLCGSYIYTLYTGVFASYFLVITPVKILGHNFQEDMYLKKERKTVEDWGKIWFFTRIHIALPWFNISLHLCSRYFTSLFLSTLYLHQVPSLAWWKVIVNTFADLNRMLVRECSTYQHYSSLLSFQQSSMTTQRQIMYNLALAPFKALFFAWILVCLCVDEVASFPWEVDSSMNTSPLWSLDQNNLLCPSLSLFM